MDSMKDILFKNKIYSYDYLIFFRDKKLYISYGQYEIEIKTFEELFELFIYFLTYNKNFETIEFFNDAIKLELKEAIQKVFEVHIKDNPDFLIGQLK